MFELMQSQRFILAAIFLSSLSMREAGAVDYPLEVKPILAEHCYRCHGSQQQKSGLRLDTAVNVRRGGDGGAAVAPGKAAESLLIRVVRGTHETLARMPYKKPPLEERQIAILERWIDAGAVGPEGEPPEVSKHWAFVPPQRAPIPPRIHALGNPIDAFILERLEREHIRPTAEADRVTLLRRVSLDLTGLPPQPAEVEAFLADPSSAAYERAVERLLASPRYGERWGRHWLDVARYADSNGYSIDAPRSIWKYRDWVVNALNSDKPFDEFVVEQIAGDMLPGATQEQRIATGFHRNTQINEEGGIDKEQFRIESIFDRVNTTGSALLGLTLACAQCHDHKFDPLSQRDYYRMFAFYNNADEPTMEVIGERAPDEELRQRMREIAEDLDRYIRTAGGEIVKWERDLGADAIAKLGAEVRQAMELPFERRSPEQKRLVYAVFKPKDPEFKRRNDRLVGLEKRRAAWVTTLVMAEKAEPRESFVFTKGDFTRRGVRVTPGVPEVLPPLAPGQEQNRLGLARWLVDPRNPLTARVFVNRVWHQYFGRGLVETENDLGTQGIPPSHPELLDWLAVEFMAPSAVGPPGPAWSMKRLHRLIVTSAVYRRGSRRTSEDGTTDPNNRWLARQSRLRMDAEVVRDVSLAAAGLLQLQLGGAPVFPPQPDGVMNLGQSRREWKANEDAHRYRRGLYTHFWRATPHPALAVFDAPDAFSSCTRRLRSNTPLQALTLLNDEAFVECAQALAERMDAAGESADAATVRLGFKLCVAREPSSAEESRLLELLAEQRAGFASAPEAARETAGRVEAAGADLARRAAWVQVARVLLNLDETITRE